MKLTRAQRRALRAMRDNDRDVRFAVGTRWALELNGLIERRDPPFGEWALTDDGHKALRGEG